MAATRSRFVDSTAAPAARPASTALKDVPMKWRRERRISPALRGQSANDGFMLNLDGSMGGRNSGLECAPGIGPLEGSRYGTASGTASLPPKGVIPARACLCDG